MSFKEVSSLDAEVTVALGKKDKAGKPYPKQAEGYFLGSRTVENKRGESKLHFLQTAKGNLGIWGTTDLNRKLGSAPVGAMVRITSTGTKPTPNGDMYTYKVEVDADNAIEVNLAGISDQVKEEFATAGRTDEDGDDEDLRESFNNDSSEDDDQAAALAAAERAAKVQALLRNSGKSKAK